MSAVVVISTQERPGATARISHLRALRLRLPLSRHAGYWFAQPVRSDGAVIFSRVTEPGGWQTTTGHRVPRKFFWVFSVPRTVFSGLHRAPALFQSSARAVAYVFQSSHSFLTVRETQLQSHTGASACPTQDGSHPTQNRVST